MDLFEIEPLQDINARRAATEREATAYLKWLGASAGLDVSGEVDFIGFGGSVVGVTFGHLIDSGGWRQIEVLDYETFTTRTEKQLVPPVYESGAFSVFMPGRNQPMASCEVLDEEGQVVRTITLPTDRKGAIAMGKAEMAKVTGLKAVRAKPKSAPLSVDSKKMAPEPAEIAIAPHGQDERTDGPVSVQPSTAMDTASLIATVEALAARVAALEGARTNSQPVELSEKIGQVLDRRSPARLRMIRRYLAIRAERAAMRSEIASLAATIDTVRMETRQAWAERDAWTRSFRREERKRRATVLARLASRATVRSARAQVADARAEARAAMAGMRSLSDRADALQRRCDELEQWEAERPVFPARRFEAVQ